MSSPADETLQDPADPSLERAQRRLARLSRVADLALELAEATQARAMAALASAPEAGAETGAEPASRPAADFIHAFDRAARAVRLCSLLESRFETDLALRLEASAGAAKARARSLKEAEAARRQAQRSPREIRRDDLYEAVSVAIQSVGTEVSDERDFHLRHAALVEKLDRDWDDDRLLNRPLGAVVKSLCKSLGLDPDWTELENEDWAIEETLSRAEGSPFADWPVPWDKRTPPAATPPPRTASVNGPGP
jgi:hypothetical protein